ncbi:hypothetical protein OEB99_07200 [Actinotalea sp. M2MS4P-6]|uniref:hypothetical protein n=1 Tax=Actinotalea sp. M2MS4P-6 TaxID=2983762 RepID=UPI0021E4E713|nr:hypothetical protein [Actinotalea sp. M2MS4P-6]MCV2394088.1 hypothetical protein [Actinotalea sp. M2MS4P-6]
MTSQTPYTAGEPSVADQVRAVLRRALRHLLWLLAGLTVVGSLVGWLTAGAAGVWGALIGVGIALVFSGTTVLSNLRTADASVAVTGAVILGAWLVKIVVVIAVLALLQDQTFYDRNMLALTLVVGVLGSVYLDYLAVTKSRMPYVQPTPPSQD